VRAHCGLDRSVTVARDLERAQGLHSIRHSDQDELRGFDVRRGENARSRRVAIHDLLAASVQALDQRPIALDDDERDALLLECFSDLAADAAIADVDRVVPLFRMCVVFG
jgi:hypothetical protein